MPATVLVVDDDTTFLTFLDRTLKRAGFRVVTASDGCEVPEMLARTAVDVVVTDLQMPGMNGWELLRTLREPGPRCAGPAARRPKLVVVSGRDEDETAAFVRRLGADAYVTKPVLGEAIVSTVRDVLKP